MQSTGWFWRAPLVALALAFAWFSLTAGLGNYYAERLRGGEAGAVDAALAWQPGRPEALRAKGEALLADDPAAAEVLLTRAFRANGGDPWALLALARHWADAGQGKGMNRADAGQTKDVERADASQAGDVERADAGQTKDVERADALVSLVAQLAPADLRLQMQLAGWWASRGRLDRVLPHWTLVLAGDPGQQRELFPVLLQMAEVAETRDFFRAVTADPPPWWTPFFGYVAAKGLELDTLRFLYLLRRQAADQPLSAEERRLYVGRLQREGLIAEAFLVWIDGLEPAERERLGLVFDGGFDLPLERRNFGWQVAENDHFSAKPLGTAGVTGPTALRLRFKGYEGHFARVSQPLFLDAGYYRLSGRVRLDSLTSKGGLRWQLRCLLPEAEAKVLADGPRFMGSADWAPFELRFEVPAGCDYQQLTLVSAGSRAFEKKLDGTLWFDDLKMLRVKDLDATARADATAREKTDGGSTPVRAEKEEGQEDVEPIETQQDQEGGVPSAARQDRLGGVATAAVQDPAAGKVTESVAVPGTAPEAKREAMN